MTDIINFNLFMSGYDPQALSLYYNETIYNPLNYYVVYDGWNITASYPTPINVVVNYEIRCNTTTLFSSSSTHFANQFTPSTFPKMYLPTTVGGQPFPSATNRLKVHVLMTQVGDLNDLIDMTQDYTDAVLGFSPNQSNSYTLVNGGLTMWVKFTYTKE